jgi:drug/metabolite transporter (DMT)-like permease
MSAVAMSPLRKAIMALALLSIIWGYNWVTMKQAMIDAGPLNFSALRFGIGGLALIPVIIFLKQSFGIPRSEWRTLAWLSFLLVVNFGFVMTALIVGGAGKISVLVYTMPFWALILARFMLHERLKRWQWLVVGVAFVGQVVLIDPMHQLGSVLSSVLAVLAGLFWAASVIVVKEMQRRENVPMITLTFWQISIAAAGFAFAGLFIPQKAITWTPLLIWCIFYSAVLSTSIAWLLFYYALKRMPVGLAGLSTLATPCVGVLSSWMVLGERPTSIEATGMVLIGSALASLALIPLIFKRAAGP